MLWQTLVDLKTKRDPRSPRWRGKMPLFLSGGASNMAFYHESIKAISQNLAKRYQPCEGIERLALSKPDNLEADVEDDAYHRLAVAWGLSYPETDIGNVTPPSEIPDVPQPPPRDQPSDGIPKEWT